jgi:Fe-S oxidoreductase
MTDRIFAPGCALMLYKPELADKLHIILNEQLGPMDQLMVCCRHDPNVVSLTEVITICPGCDKRFRNDYPLTTTVSLWEILAENDFFEFPDYHGKTMTIHDACPTRDQERVQAAIRKVIKKMHIDLVEPLKTGSRSICCGDSFWGLIPVDDVKDQMRKRASEMPVEDVIVHCVSCIKSMVNGGKRPRYLVDLLFNETTVPKTFEPDEWHAELNAYIETH